MDAEKTYRIHGISNLWWTKTLKKLARRTKFHITPLGIYIYIYIYIVKFHALPNRNNKRINMILYQNIKKKTYIYIYDIFNTLGLTSKCPSWGFDNDMPTHANKMDKTGGNLPVLCRVEACVGMPELGHLLVRPSVLNRSSIWNYFDMISYYFIYYYC